MAVEEPADDVCLLSNEFLANGGDVFSLQQILGHSPSSLQVTRRYVDLLDEDLRAIHREASPVDRLGK
jgi:integrase/recombinase XerD